ncbi:YihD family protein [Pseudaeromonas sharmana]|uniref:YihD family protein n=1 Tax=Pseudaeromonas sharmana TaxID=328412 RepID=A0ABV8CLB5_9GAMM
MQCHRIEELMELLQQEWLADQDLSLMAFLDKIANEAGFSQPLRELSDDVLIYQLKMRSKGSQEMIPGLAKDCVPDFKEALLRARGIIKD